MADNNRTRSDLMLFGALGDLAKRKLFPALYQLDRSGLLDQGSRILAIARDQTDTDGVRRHLQDKLREYVKADEFDESVV